MLRTASVIPRLAPLSLIVAVTLGCGGDPATGASAPADDGKADGAPALPGTTQRLWLQTGAAPPVEAYPSALVYRPVGLSLAAPLDVVVYVHGFYNCIDNDFGSASSRCSTGGPVRIAHDIGRQLEASGRAAILVMPEVARDQASADPGALAADGALRAFLDEVLGQLPGPAVPLSAADVGRLVVAVHSGGYKAAAAFVARGGLPIDEVYLLDALYDETETFSAWIDADRDAFATTPPRRRLVDVYSTLGGTLAESEAFARSLAPWAGDALAHGLVFHHAPETHDGIAAAWLARALTTSTLPPR